MQIVNGTTFAQCEHTFLHDADAFFLEADGLERQYRECRDRGMCTLGVTARWDPQFTAAGLTIPGTWELMYSTRWARSRAPWVLKGGMRPTPDGTWEFDTMLHAQYLDYASGRVGVMEQPPRFVHFNGTIVTYRAFRDRAGRTVADDLFRILLLALLEDLMPDKGRERVVSHVEELARGLDDPNAPVAYRSDSAARVYPQFRAMITDMCGAPIFAGERAARISQALAPFDDHFAEVLVASQSAVDSGADDRRMRRHGLG